MIQKENTSTNHLQLEQIKQKLTIKDETPEDQLNEAKIKQKKPEVKKLVKREELVDENNKFVYNFIIQRNMK